MSRRNLVSIENTRFIWKTNFSGDPARSRFNSDARKASIVIPDYDQAMDLRDFGVNVKETRPRPGEEDDFEPTYYVDVKVNYDSKWPPNIYLVSGDAEPLLLDEESVDILDKCYILNVNAVLNISENRVTGKKSLYVRTMYVEQDIEDDPFADRYRR